MTHITTRRRVGFTLVEMLVAIALAIVLLSLAVGVTQSSAFDSYKVVGAADRLTQYMLVAKNRAVRDRAPRGIRMILDGTGNCREVAYIEQPDVWVPPSVVQMLIFSGDQNQTYSGMPPPYLVTSITDKRVVLRWPLGAATSAIIQEFETNGVANADAAVRPGDLLLVPEFDAVQRIVEIRTIAGMSAGFASRGGAGQLTGAPFDVSGFQGVELILGSTESERLKSFPSTGAAYSNKPDPASNPWSPTFQLASGFAFTRQARPILGEPTVQLPSGMFVDMANSLNVPSGPSTHRDILFSASGNAMANDGLIALLVRDADVPGVSAPLKTDYAVAGQMLLVCLYTRTGAVATQPVNPPSAPPAAADDAYKFARDGINTGL